MSRVEQELSTLMEHLVFIGVRVSLSLVFCVELCRSLFRFVFLLTIVNPVVHVAQSLVFCVVLSRSFFSWFVLLDR